MSRYGTMTYIFKWEAIFVLYVVIKVNCTSSPINIKFYRHVYTHSVNELSILWFGTNHAYTNEICLLCFSEPLLTGHRFNQRLGQYHKHSSFGNHVYSLLPHPCQWYLKHLS